MDGANRIALALLSRGFLGDSNYVSHGFLRTPNAVLRGYVMTR